MSVPRSWLHGAHRVWLARRILIVAMILSISMIVFMAREDRGSALAMAGELVLAMMVVNLAWVVWEVHQLSRGLHDAGLERSAPAQLKLGLAIRKMLGVLVIMLVSGSGLMLWAGRLLPQDPTGEFALMFWVLLASGFSLSIYVAEMITHLIHAFEATLLQLLPASEVEPE